ncbi:MAG: CDP-diacylglycerol--serine O-phosphatidyltransferase [Fretibacterium sp.]|uniref:CDP-diacylglycerol--serine O-phosphatidyltransferase n=1 Tax=Fretibacterium sp. OH1220_COT-178 TaxID=2491047 RepID=UPI001F22B502|nr:CDP-diacylglycerol--serine O-phosphatidyltransferase [Fretibacterium sp. OH1220_COT-178]MDO4785896.1 CDP-diacylglycerol--serine O-phosphatidyltransferase [Fretibacterium sp.]
MSFLKGRKWRRRRKPLEFRQIAPNMVTSGNLLCGLFSLMLAVEGRFVPAAWLVFFAVIFDGLDGKVARSLGGGTQFGLEFDSLADLVSFGVAPGMLVYMASLRGVGGLFGVVAACFFVLCVALRLARFNVVHVPGPFQGLPSPAGGLFVASFVLADAILHPAAMAAILAFAGFLMVSSVPYANLKKLTKRSADRKRCMALLVMVSLCFAFLGAAAPLFLFALYIVSGLVRFDWGQWLLLPEARNQEAVTKPH